MKKLPQYLLLSCVLACIAACAALRSAGYTAAGAGGGALAGSAVGGPLGAAVGGAAGAVAAHTISENSELRDGGLVGEDALAAENKRLRITIAELQGRPPVTVPQPFIPHWVWWAAAGALLWLKGHHLIAALKGKNAKALIRMILPSWVGNPKKTATGS